MRGLELVLVFGFNVFKGSILVRSMCLWVVFKDLLLALSLFLCIVLNECSSVVFVGIGMILLVSLWYVIVLAFEVSLIFVFMLKVLLVLSRPLLNPHTRVCGLS